MFTALPLSYHRPKGEVSETRTHIGRTKVENPNQATRSHEHYTPNNTKRVPEIQPVVPTMLNEVMGTSI